MPQSQFLDEEKQTNLLEYVALLRKHIRLIAFACIATVVATFIFTRLSPRTYRAKSTIFVYADLAFENALTTTQQPLLFISSPAVGYVQALLQSHTISEAVAESLHLLNSPAWKRHSVKIAGEDRLISVEVDSPDAYVSAKIANAYVDAASDSILQQARHRTDYISTLMARTQRELAGAENALQNFQAGHPGMEAATPSTEAINSRASLEKDLMMDQIALAENRELAQTTGSVPELVKLKEEESSVRAKMAATRDKIRILETQIKKFPGNSLELERLQRNVKVKESVYQLLSQQHESASLREQEEIIPYRIIDRAIPQFALIRPNMKMNLVFGFAASLLLGVVLAFVSEYFEGLARLQ